MPFPSEFEFISSPAAVQIFVCETESENIFACDEIAVEIQSWLSLRIWERNGLPSTYFGIAQARPVFDPPTVPWMLPRRGALGSGPWAQPHRGLPAPCPHSSLLAPLPVLPRRPCPSAGSSHDPTGCPERPGTRGPDPGQGRTRLGPPPHADARPFRHYQPRELRGEGSGVVAQAPSWTQGAYPRGPRALHNRQEPGGIYPGHGMATRTRFGPSDSISGRDWWR